MACSDRPMGDVGDVSVQPPIVERRPGLCLPCVYLLEGRSSHRLARPGPYRGAGTSARHPDLSRSVTFGHAAGIAVLRWPAGRA